MSTARTLALGALMLVGVGAVSDAQARGGNRGGRDFGLARDLNLTETQRTQIRAIHQKYQPQHQAIHNQQIAEIRATLTADQRVKFDARQQQMAERRAKAGAKSGERAWGRKGLRRGGPVTPDVRK